MLLFTILIFQNVAIILTAQCIRLREAVATGCYLNFPDINILHFITLNSNSRQQQIDRQEQRIVIQLAVYNIVC